MRLDSRVLCWGVIFLLIGASCATLSLGRTPRGELSGNVTDPATGEGFEACIEFPGLGLPSIYCDTLGFFGKKA